MSVFLSSPLLLSSLCSQRLEEAEEEADLIKLSTGAAGKATFNLLVSSPLPTRQASKYKSAPTWLMSLSDLRKHAPKLKFEDISLHLISQGNDPSCLLTIREIDPELVDKTKRTSILEDSKTGVLGRIVTGLRIKIMKVPGSLHRSPPSLTLAQNLCCDGIVAIAGELTDSPAALASVLFSLTQAYSMNTLGSLAMWMKLIAAGCDDLAVSKHSEHVRPLPSPHA
jgi:hypothetical protein